MTTIHPSAVVDPKAELGVGVSIGPFSVIEAGVRVGDRCQIGPHVVLSGRTTLGSGNRVFSHNAIGGIPQDLKYAGEDTHLEIGDNNTFREFMTVNTGTVGGGGVTRIGNGNLFMAYVHIAHDCIIGDGAILANAVTLAGHVTVEDRAVIGGLTAVHQFSRIGQLAMIGGCSAVDQDVPPFCLAIGNRVTLRGLNLTGLKRAGLSREAVRDLRDAYALLFSEQTPLADTIPQARAKWPDDPRVATLTGFLESSERGVCR